MVLQLVFGISKRKFDKYKEFVIEKMPTDYYTLNPRLRKSYLYRPSNKSKYNQRRFEFIQNNMTPYNLHFVVKHDEFGLQGFFYRGFIANKDKQIASYALKSGTAWGVFKEQGKHFLFFTGNRESLINMPYYHQLIALNATPCVWIEPSKSQCLGHWYDATQA